MELSVIDAMVIPVITAACLCIGYVMKRWLPTDNKWIPTVLLVLGAASGLILFGADYEGIVKGMVSGLAAVGLHQAFYQHLKLPMGDDEIYSMGAGDPLDLIEEDAEGENETALEADLEEGDDNE